MTECMRCHYEGPIMCSFSLNDETLILCPDCVVDFNRFLMGYTLNEKGILITRGFKTKRDKE